MEFTTLDLVMPVPIVDPADDAMAVQMHRWKAQVRDVEDKTKAFIGFRAKVKGQCTRAMKGRIMRHLIMKPPTQRRTDLLS